MRTDNRVRYPPVTRNEVRETIRRVERITDLLLPLRVHRPSCILTQSMCVVHVFRHLQIYFWRSVDTRVLLRVEVRGHSSLVSSAMVIQNEGYQRSLGGEFSEEGRESSFIVAIYSTSLRQTNLRKTQRWGPIGVCCPVYVYWPSCFLHLARNGRSLDRTTLVFPITAVAW